MRPVALASVCLLAAASLGLTGCGTGMQAPGAPVALGTLHGTIMGGNQPVAGATVSLWITQADKTATAVATANSAASGTGTSGSSYKLATAPTPLATATTTAYGSFIFPGSANLGQCNAGSQLYVTAAGGNPGLVAGTNNPSLLLVAALGACSSISTSNTILINEVTTIAAAYALQGFVPAGGIGFGTATSPGTITAGIATSATNGQGLVDGFLNAASLASFSTGTANTVTPLSSASNGTGTVPTALLNTLANVLVPCVNSTGSTANSSPCATLFSAATPPAGGPNAPVNTFQAALDIANYPVLNASAIYAIYANQPTQTLAFSPGLTAQPNDFTVAISYTNTPLGNSTANPTGFVIDDTDNVYVTGLTYTSGTTATSLIEMSPQGVLSVASQAVGGLAPNVNSANDNVRNAAIDPAGNLWLSDGATSKPISSGVLEWIPNGGAASNAINVSYSSVDSNLNNYAIASDNLGNIWTSSYKASTCATTGSSRCTVVELVKGATSYTPTITFPIATGSATTVADLTASTASGPGTGVGGSRAIAYDVKTGNVWTTNIGEGSVQLFQTTTAAGTPAVAPAVPQVQILGTAQTPTAGFGSVAVAVDNASNAWFITTGSGSASDPAALYSISKTFGPAALATGNANAGLLTPGYLVIDGNNNIFIANTGVTGTLTNGNSVVEYNPALASFVSGTLGYAPGAGYGSATAFSTTNGQDLIIKNKYISVDRSGAIWTQNGAYVGSSTLYTMVQILGLASPTQPILANGGYGQKP